MSKAITIVLKNNTTIVQPIQLGITPNVFSGINANTQYRWNITSQNLNDLTTVSVTYVLNGITTTVIAPIITNSLSGIINALNSLNVGSFWSTTSGGNTYINTYNDFVTYTNLTINNNGSILITVSVLALTTLTFNLTMTNPNHIDWDWGDGTTQQFNSNSPSPSHLYSIAGTYTIIITFTNTASLLSLTHSPDITLFDIVNDDLTGLQSLVLSANNISSFDTAKLSNSTSLATLKLDNNQLSTFNAVPLTNGLTTLWLFGNILTSVNLPLPVNLVDVRIHSNNLPVSQVNAVLIALDSAGQLNGIVNLAAQTPAAPPSGAGITAKNNLIGKGWTVFTD